MKKVRRSGRMKTVQNNERFMSCLITLKSKRAQIKVQHLVNLYVHFQFRIIIYLIIKQAFNKVDSKRHMQLYLKQRNKNDTSLHREYQQPKDQSALNFSSQEQLINTNYHRKILYQGLQSRRKSQQQMQKYGISPNNFKQKQVNHLENFIISQKSHPKKVSQKQIPVNNQSKELQFRLKGQTINKKNSAYKQKVMEKYQNIDVDFAIQTLQIKIPERPNHKNFLTMGKGQIKKQYFQAFAKTMKPTQKPDQNFTMAINKFLDRRTKESFIRTYSSLSKTTNNFLDKTKADYKKLTGYQSQKTASEQRQRNQNLKKLYRKNMETILTREKYINQLQQNRVRRQQLKMKFDKKYISDFLRSQTPNKKLQKNKYKSKAQFYNSLLQRQTLFNNQFIRKANQDRTNSSLSKTSSKQKVKRIRNPASVQLRKKFQSNLVSREKSLDIHVIYSKSNPFIVVDHLTPFDQKQRKKNLSQAERKRKDAWKQPNKIFKNIDISLRFNNRLRPKRSKTEQLSGWNFSTQHQKQIQSYFG